MGFWVFVAPCVFDNVILGIGAIANASVVANACGIALGKTHLVLVMDRE